MAAAGLVWRLAFSMLAAVSLATLLGAVWETFDLFAPFQAQLAFAWLIAWGAFALSPRVRNSFRQPIRVAVGAAILLGLHLTLIAGIYLPLNPAVRDSEQPLSLKVVWFNMEHKASALQALEDQILDDPPDLLALAETNRDTAPDPQWGLQYVFHDEVAQIGIWSRWPLEDRRAHPVAGDRDLVDVTVVIEGRRLPLIATHWRLPTRPSQKAAAIALAMLVRERPDCLVLGDLNATPWSASLRRLERDGQLRRVRLPFGPFNTWAADPWHLLAVPIDHLLLKGGLRVGRIRLLPWNTSDHRPLQAWLDLSLPG